MTTTAPIYLDNAATTQVAPEIAQVVIDCMREAYGNPASAHHMGIAAERRVKEARQRLLAAIGDPDGSKGEIYWTSGGTESDALCFIGAARAHGKRGRHLVLSAIEHSAVRESALLLKSCGTWEVSVAPVDRSGVTTPELFGSVCRPDTTVAALMLVNNEIGTLQPVAAVAAACKRINPHMHIHCDAVQALGKVPIDVGALGVDSLAFSAHKIHGPKGVGAVWIAREAHVDPFWGGGRQQGELRSGTLNVPGIAAMGEAVVLAERHRAELAQHFAELRRIMIDRVSKSGLTFRENGVAAPRAPHVLSLAFEAPAEPLLHVLESRGVLVSAGSACAERERRPSPVLAAIQLPPELGVVRLSFGRTTTVAEVETAAEVLIDAVRSLQ
jgi:cysteine desulfurase